MKVVILGGHQVGKTSLFIAYEENWFNFEYVPSVFDTTTVHVNLTGEKQELQLCEAQGSDDYARYRALSYPETDLFLLCFSCTNKMSLENVASKWYPEILLYCPSIPFFLVATKVDLVDGHETEPEILREAKIMAEKLGGRYFECSSVTGKGVRRLFEEAVGVNFNEVSRCRKNHCNIS